jgi:hypothetical protein
VARVREIDVAQFPAPLPFPTTNLAVPANCDQSQRFP